MAEMVEMAEMLEMDRLADISLAQTKIAEGESNGDKSEVISA